MDVTDLWELLSYVDDWTFETFPWHVFALCHSSVERNPSELLSKSSDASQDEDNNEIISFDPVPPEVPNQQQVVHSIHSSQNLPSEDSEDYQNALHSSDVEDSKEEQNFLIVPSVDILTLDQSMVSLKLALEDRSTLSAFEKLNKKKAKGTMDVAKLPENVAKNRYKDVLPYDDNRVVLKEGPNGDYINASFVQMSLPHPRKANQYIATQGPLPQTCDDFWQMVWEQECGLIVMVTTLKERNRVKCHQYWPELYQTTGEDLQVTCFSETTSTTGITRDFLISHQKEKVERHVVQLQYINWPDHGVPQDSTDFLEFVQQLRNLRRDIGGTVVVHCSAGVGRTGVLILMETALGYIDADEPIQPLELVRQMRDQRVMMVQTVVQYKFICEAILKAYNDRYERPAKPDGQVEFT